MYFRVVPKYFLIFSSLDCPLSKHFQVLLSISRYFRVVPQYFFYSVQALPSTSEYFQILLITSKYFRVVPKYFFIFSPLDRPAPSSTCPPLTIHPSHSSDAFFRIFHSPPSDPSQLGLILSSLDCPCTFLPVVWSPLGPSTPIEKARLHL